MKKIFDLNFCPMFSIIKQRGSTKLFIYGRPADKVEAADSLEVPGVKSEEAGLAVGHGHAI